MISKTADVECKIVLQYAYYVVKTKKCKIVKKHAI